MFREVRVCVRAPVGRQMQDPWTKGTEEWGAVAGGSKGESTCLAAQDGGSLAVSWLLLHSCVLPHSLLRLSATQPWGLLLAMGATSPH